MIEANVNYGEADSPGNYYQEGDWQEFEFAQVAYIDVTCIYELGKLVQIIYKLDSNPEGIRLIDYTNNEQVVKVYSDGRIEYYDAKTKLLMQRNLPTGEVEFYQNGKLVAKRIGKILYYYDEDGQVIKTEKLNQ